MTTPLSFPSVAQGSTAGWDVPLKADITAIRNRADSTSLAFNVKAYGAVGNGSADDTAAFVAAKAACIASGGARTPERLYIPGGTYKVTATLDWRCEGWEVFGDPELGTTIASTISNAPLAQLGYQYQNIHDLCFTYSTAPTVGQTGSVMWQMHKPFRSTFARINMYNSNVAIACYQGDVTTPTGEVGGNYMFSCQFTDFYINGYMVSAINTSAYNSSNTGNVWTNMYIRNAPIAAFQTPSSYPVFIGTSDGDYWNQLNIEAVTLANAGGIIINGSSATINSLHFEGINLNLFDGSLVVVNGQGSTFISTLNCQGSVFAAASGNQSAAKVVGGARLIVAGQVFRNSNTFNGTFAHFSASDGTGAIWAFGVDFSYVTTAKLADATAIPVIKQINETIYHYRNAAGKNVLSGTIAPTTGTWVVGDTVWNTAPAAAGTPGWVCTGAGTPGTWKAMANVAA